ncbi:hypothetical protein O6A27_18450, partial [Escherichia coli]|nr:hypothetical protein [Escherichia coli]
KTSIFSHSVYLFIREFSLQDSRGGSNILNLQKLINISHQLEITPVSDDSKPEILQLLNSVKEHIAELDQEITVFCQQND